MSKASRASHASVESETLSANARPGLASPALRKTGGAWKTHASGTLSSEESPAPKKKGNWVLAGTAARIAATQKDDGSSGGSSEVHVGPPAKGAKPPGKWSMQGDALEAPYTPKSPILKEMQDSALQHSQAGAAASQESSFSRASGVEYEWNADFSGLPGVSDLLQSQPSMSGRRNGPLLVGSSSSANLHASQEASCWRVLTSADDEELVVQEVPVGDAYAAVPSGKWKFVHYIVVRYTDGTTRELPYQAAPGTVSGGKWKFQDGAYHIMSPSGDRVVHTVRDTQGSRQPASSFGQWVAQPAYLVTDASGTTTVSRIEVSLSADVPPQTSGKWKLSHDWAAKSGGADRPAIDAFGFHDDSDSDDSLYSGLGGDDEDGTDLVGALVKDVQDHDDESDSDGDEVDE